MSPAPHPARPTFLAATLETLRRANGFRFPPLGPLAFRWVPSSLPNPHDTELFPGVKLALDLTDGTQRATWWQGERFETPTPQILAAWGADSDVFFDVGANFGFFSYWMSYKHPEIAKYAFEPNPQNFERLVEAKRANHLASLHPCQLGLSDQRQTLSLRVTSGDTGHSSFGINPTVNVTNSVTVPTLPFDEWRKEAGLALPSSPRWIIKIDVEGFEFRVLTGMKEALQKQAFRGIAIEILDHTLEYCGTSREQVTAVLTESGYRPFETTSAGKQYHPYRTANHFFVPASLA